MMNKKIYLLQKHCQISLIIYKVLNTSAKKQHTSIHLYFIFEGTIYDGSLKLQDYVFKSQETIRAMYILPLDKYKKDLDCGP